MATWEYIGKRNLQKNLVIVKTASRTAGVYGETYVDDQQRPEKTFQLETDEGLTDTEADALEALAETRDGVTSITDNAGKSWAGRIVALSLERAKGTELWKATLTLRPQDDE